MKSFKTAWKHIRRSPYQTLVAVLTMYITLLLAGIFTVSSGVSIAVVEYFESKPQITVFFDDTSAREEADALVATLKSTGKVVSTTFKSREDALALYQEQNKDDPLLLEMVTADILPASLEVMTEKPEYLAELEPIIKKAKGVEEVVFQKDVVDALLKWTKGIRVVMGSLVVILAINGLLVLMTVTSMKIALRKQEIEILHLVGASRWYIRAPFILEGGFYGAFGGILAFLTILGVVVWMRQEFLTFLGEIPIIALGLSDVTGSVFILSSLGFLGGLSGVGFILGSFGALIAVNRYFKH